MKLAEKGAFDRLVTTTSEAETGRQETPLPELPEGRRKEIQGIEHERQMKRGRVDDSNTVPDNRTIRKTHHTPNHYPVIEGETSVGKPGKREQTESKREG